jgi:hypothetical protein
MDDEPTPPAYRLPPFYSVSCVKLAVMSMCTLDLYLLYWFYKQWEKVIDQPEAKGFVNLNKPRPYLRAVFSVIFCYPLFRRVKKVSRELRLPSKFFPGPLAILYLLLWVPANLTSDAWVIGLFNFVPLLIVQREINRINRVATPDARVDASFSKWNIALIVLGTLLLSFALIGTLTAPKEEYARNTGLENEAIKPDRSVESPTEKKLRDYIALQTDKAFEEPSSLQPDLRRTIDLAIKQTEDARTYSSRRIVTDLTSGNSIEWRLDFVKPDKLHILRTANGATDEWIKIGETRYHAAPPTLPTDSPEWEMDEHAVLIRDSIDVLRHLKAKSGASYRVQGERYLQLVYEGGVHVWINLSKSLISKIEVISTDRKVQHVFAAFNDPIVISDPSNTVIPFHP